MVPATQPAHASIADLTCSGSGSNSTMSETASRPPGRRTRKASLSPRCFAGREVEAALGEEAVAGGGGGGVSLVGAFEKAGVRPPRGGFFFVGRAQLLARLAPAVGVPAGTDAPRREQDVEAG